MCAHLKYAKNIQICEIKPHFCEIFSLIVIKTYFLIVLSSAQALCRILDTYFLPSVLTPQYHDPDTFSLLS